MAYDINGSYRKWALRYQNETDSTYLEKVSSWYFYSASIVWIGPSFLWALIAACLEYAKKKEKFLVDIFCCCKAENKIFGKCLLILLVILFLPFGTVLFFFFMYLIIPLNLFHNAIRAVIEGDNFKESDDYGCVLNSDYLAGMKFIELLGEALPQVILNIVFISNNYPYLRENDVYFGIPIPISIVSAVFSIGSILMGCKTILSILEKY